MVPAAASAARPRPRPAPVECSASPPQRPQPTLGRKTAAAIVRCWRRPLQKDRKESIHEEGRSLGGAAAMEYI
jgi:hypothetical protein